MPVTKLNSQTLQNHNRTHERRNRYLNSTGSYPDSDYMSSLGSLQNGNYRHNLGNKFPDRGLTWGGHNTDLSKLSPNGYYNHGYGSGYNTYTSSTRDDDETTTTSGSYTINPEELDDEIASAALNASQFV